MTQNKITRRGLIGAAAVAGIGTTLPASQAEPAPKASAEDAAYALGLEAYTYAYPLIYFARIRYNGFMIGDAVMKTKARWGAWTIRNVPATPEMVGAPQTDTLYGSVWLDLGTEPYIMQVPKTDGRYWSIQMCDLFGETYGLPSRRAFKSAETVGIVGPGWNGTLPSGITQVYRSPMRQTLNLMRMFHDGSDADRERGYEIAKQFTLKPLSAFVARQDWTAPASTVFAPFDTAKDPLADFKTLQLMLQECPPPAADAEIMQRFASIGLAQGVTDGFASLSEAQRRGLARAEKEGRERIIALTKRMPGTRTVNGWTSTRAAAGIYDDGDYLYRGAVALLGVVATPVSENVYMAMQVEPGLSTPLSGDARYTLRIPPGEFPRVGAFWSIHAYGFDSRLIANPINRYAIGDRSKFKLDADGGLTIYVQAEDPGGDLSSNWLPTVKGKPFQLITREYEPMAGVGAMRWRGPEVRRAG
jgi:hypothetical protein